MIAGAIAAAALFVPALAKPHQLWMLPRERLQIDHGRVFGRGELSFELQKLKGHGDCPEINLHARKDSKFPDVGFVILKFKEAGCDNIGITGEEGPN